MRPAVSRSLVVAGAVALGALVVWFRGDCGGKEPTDDAAGEAAEVGGGDPPAAANGGARRRTARSTPRERAARDEAGEPAEESSSAVRDADEDWAISAGLIFPELTGRVVDAETGEPVAGARVLYVVEDNGKRSWDFTSRTNADGKFAHARPSSAALAGESEELRVVAAGYRPWRSGTARMADIGVRLVRYEEPPLPARVCGRVTSPGGQAFQGRILVVANSDFGDAERQWTVADAEGEFVLEGVPADLSWRWNVYGSSKRDTATVGAGSEVRIHLEVSDASAGTGPVPLPAATREVFVRGIPGGAGGAVVRAEVQPGRFWRAAVVGDFARFPALPVGKWDFVLARPGEPERKVTYAVVHGTGPQEIQFAP